AKFFAGIARQLRALWRRLSPSLRDQYRPAKSVDKWVRQMFKAATVREAIGQPVTAKVAEAAPKAAIGTALVVAGPRVTINQVEVPDVQAMDLAALVDFIRGTLTPAERQVLDRYTSRAAITTRLRELFPEYTKALDDAATGMENRIALAFMAWNRGDLQAGPE